MKTMEGSTFLKQWSEILRNITLLGQLGLSLAMPLLLCLAVCWLLIVKGGLSAWIYVPGFILGIGASCMNRNRKNRPSRGYNRHI